MDAKQRAIGCLIREFKAAGYEYTRDGDIITFSGEDIVEVTTDENMIIISII